MNSPLLDVANLSVDVEGESGMTHAVKRLRFAIERGETFALVGESGCGKSMTALALLRLLPQQGRIAAGQVRLEGHDLNRLPESAMRGVRGGRIGIIFQEPATSLNPVMRVGDQIIEVLRAHTDLRGAAARERAAHWLARVGIADALFRLDDYPFQFSGGQKQRIMIAIALAAEPGLLIADEPTTALDMTVQRQILSLLRARRDAGDAILLISHDLAVVAELADRVLVMRAGQVVEQGSARDVLSAPTHPYTRALLAAIPTAASRGFRLATAERVPLPPKRIDAQAPVLAVDALTKRYGGRDAPPAVDGVSFSLARGETLGIVGESGSGKSTVARIVLGLVEPDAGTVTLDGQPWNGIPEAARRTRRARLQLIAQDPYSSFDPRYSVGRIIGEGLEVVGLHGDARRRRVLQLLDEVQLGAACLDRYPRELSGGQRQRVAIARAFASNPALLVADEPVSALDVSIQAQVLDLLADLQAEHGTAMLFISHDLGVVHHVADRILVMRRGRVVESGPVTQVFDAPSHPYTASLLDALPTLPGGTATAPTLTALA